MKNHFSPKNINVFSLLLCIYTFFPMQLQALVCPNKVSSNSIKVIYIKYKVTDEVQIRNNQQAGYPNVAGDEFRELYVNDHFRKERLYGRLIADDVKHFKEQFAIALEKGNRIEQRQNRGEDVPLEEIDQVTQEFVETAHKLKIKEYDRIKITTEEYAGKFNQTSKKGYGQYQLNNDTKSQALSESLRENKTWLLSQADLINQKIGFQNKKTDTRKILNYECDNTVIDTKTKGWNRELGKMEVCTSTINGLDIVLAAAMGVQGKRYTMEAIKISPNLIVSKNEFCLPDYVTMK